MISNRKKVGILGGTLNPIHYGHLFIAEQARLRFQLEYVIFMPTGNPPHKSGDNILSKKHREAMTKLAIQDNNHFRYSDMELNREGMSYTSDTLQILCKQNPDVEYYFILGADSLFSLEEWHEPEEIFKRAVIVAAGRSDGFRQEAERETKKQADYLIQKYNCRIKYLEAPLITISSTSIRNLVSRHESIRYLVPMAVEQYICHHKLYDNE